jgi:hypothetical protein
MENFKGTKGKWLVSELNFDEIKSESGFSIADVWDMQAGIFPNPDEAKANALLISKAPEMLEMLEKLTLVFDNFRMPTEANLKTYSSEIKQLIKEATEL